MDYIIPVVVSGMSRLLAETFINNGSRSLSPDVLIKKLTRYPDFGKVVYNQTRSGKESLVTFVMVTVLQLIVSRFYWIAVWGENRWMYL